MIAVIADDITGAAEIAAIGWRRGLSAQVQMTPNPKAGADLVTIDTDTRSLPGDTARSILKDIAGRLRALPVQWHFKKVDSVLRGNVGAELETLMEALGKRRTILAPANPSKGRIIVDGRYYINGVPLDETEFAQDPEHPARSSSIADLLSASSGGSLKSPGAPGDLGMAGPGEPFPKPALRSSLRLPPALHVLDPAAYLGEETGIVVAQARTVADLAQWSGCLDDDTLAAGGADFFQAILDRRSPSHQTGTRDMLRPTKAPKLFVCGSKRRAGSQPAHVDMPVCLMPERAPGLLGQWTSDIVTALAASRCAVVAVGRAAERNSLSALDVRTRMAVTVQRVVERTEIGELFIEGGATASAILRRLGWDTLDVQGEYAPGVVRLAVTKMPDRTVTLKPGSYPWPEELLTLT
ncbi:MAG: hypothetical protein JW993_19160 [Sedimentisphaerales bacterium]|nr:hypothetical protein [Sedimentisphaerales bacterium]